FARHRAHVLAVAVPAALADVDGAAARLRRRVVAGIVAHPLDVAEVGADGARDAAGTCLRRQHWQHALHEHRERHQGEAGADRHRGDRPHAGRPSEVLMSARTTNDMPTSMLSPVNVRSHQYGLMATTVSRNSAPAISMNP